MKKRVSIIIFLLLILALLALLFLRTLHAAETNSAEMVTTDVSEDSNSDISLSVEATPEPVYVSDPVYGDEITQEELETLREEDSTALDSPNAPSITIGEEFVIELEDNQSTGGF